MENTEMTTKQEEYLASQIPVNATGLEDSNQEDVIIPRIKVINALSPERQDGVADEGDIINSLTQEKVEGKRFIPIKQYYSNIAWNPDRSADARIFCRSMDGRVGTCDEGTLSCKQCGKNKFDNNKTGKDAQPTCTAYLNFLGFFEDSPMPVVLSFARTNYNEGRKMLSIAKSMRQAVWNFAYTLEARQVTKDRNKWYIIVPNMKGATTTEERALAFELYNTIEASRAQVDYEDVGGYSTSRNTDAEIEAEI